MCVATAELTAVLACRFIRRFIGDDAHDGSDIGGKLHAGQGIVDGADDRFIRGLAGLRAAIAAG